ncbi:hypothetical protein Gpo141_00013640 [Globisporangium polare]
MSEAVAKGVQGFACGQLVSLFSMASLIMAKYLAVRDVSTPSFLNCCFYILLAIACLSYSWRQQGKQFKLQQQSLDGNGNDTSSATSAEPTTPPGSPLTTPARMWSSSQLEDPEQEPQQSLTRHPQGAQLQDGEQRWWVYPLVVFFDLQANCMAVRSLAFTDYVTVGLMLNLTIPFVSMLSCVARGRKYSWRHALGCVLASAGGLALFVGSYYRDQSDASSQQVYGSFMALLAAFLYGASNVTNQVCLKVQGVNPVIESLGMISAWASGLAMIQMVLLERAQVAAIEWTSDVSLCFAAYIAAMLSFYALVSLLPQTFTSPMYNLSILASNLYLALASVYLFGEKPHDYFFLALLLVLVGLTMHCVEHARTESKSAAELQQEKPPHVNFKSMHTPSDLKLIAIQIEQAAL